MVGKSTSSKVVKRYRREYVREKKCSDLMITAIQQWLAPAIVLMIKTGVDPTSEESILGFYRSFNNNMPSDRLEWMVKMTLEAQSELKSSSEIYEHLRINGVGWNARKEWWCKRLLLVPCSKIFLNSTCNPDHVRVRVRNEVIPLSPLYLVQNRIKPRQNGLERGEYNAYIRVSTSIVFIFVFIFIFKRIGWLRIIHSLQGLVTPGKYFFIDEMAFAVTPRHVESLGRDIILGVSFTQFLAIPEEATYVFITVPSVHHIHLCVVWVQER